MTLNLPEADISLTFLTAVTLCCKLTMFKKIADARDPAPALSISSRRLIGTNNVLFSSHGSFALEITINELEIFYVFHLKFGIRNRTDCFK